VDVQVIEQTCMKMKPNKILEKELEICDAHHHIWDFPTSKYLADELLEDFVSGHNVTSSVYMECGHAYDTSLPKHLASTGETKFIENFAEEILKRTNGDVAACKAIVSYTDLCLGSRTQESLEAHLAASNRFCGVRHATGWDADKNIRNAHTKPTEGLMLTKEFSNGIRALTKLNLSFDAWLYHPQILEFATLAKNHPNQIMVLDHVGGPLGIGRYAGARKLVYEQWKKNISLLATQENVYVKLGGLAMSITGMVNKRLPNIDTIQLAALTAPYYLHVIDKFGAERCIFESNFPVDKVGVSYSTLWNSFKYITQSFSPSEKLALFKGTAEKIYHSGN